MKIHYIKVLIILFIIHTNTLYAQNATINPLDSVLISTQYKAITIEHFLDSLHEKYNIHFAYDPLIIPYDSVINANYSKQNISYILNNIFQNHDLQFEASDKQIIISQTYRNTKITNYLTLEGNITSNENDKPLPLVNIAIIGETIGTTTNFDGYYKFLIPKKFIGDTIHFTSIGYESHDIIIPKSDSLINVTLNTTSIKLKEIEVKYLKASQIIENTINSIHKNYPDHPMLLTAFFRETIKQDDKYIEISEAVLDIYKSSYLSSGDIEKARFVKGRKHVDDEQIALARLKLAGGPSLFASLDIVKHPDFLGLNDDVKYVYNYIGKTIERDRIVYIIEFKPLYETENIYYQGKLHIDSESFAILSADFKMTKQTLKEGAKYLIKKNAKKIKSTPIYTQYHIEYRPMGDKWILNNIRGELKIKIIDKRNKKTKSLYNTTSELLVTNAINGKGQKIKYSDTFKSSYVLADWITNYDEDFWKDYNIINPEKSLSNIFKSTAVEINVVPLREKTKP
ncbi:carboxypeptidase-like regulatory domain-containing protein [Plebeiibacterium sediminum]|uniref:Carboxypeptidase-like regulatory domain-containing protein n=1 Tax=Plebeiibacterium sediminum TaxID=2992112 RepID=A0AAE3M6J1_9BACT|nr:carboxypeptidase-like regulatory domain-containing protein [Plebeiobacterium sediminum]MCW3787704.1 carboxypeptidase-like regulatory domain-containing protein [Plebeiobacterium sediminum]